MDTLIALGTSIAFYTAPLQQYRLYSKLSLYKRALLWSISSDINANQTTEMPGVGDER